MNVQAVLPLEGAINETWWNSVDATSSGSGIATFTFGKQQGTKTYLVKIRKTAGGSTSTCCYVRPQYDGPVAIPRTAAQLIPVQLADDADATLMLLKLDSSQSFQLYVTGLDNSTAYTASIATNNLDIINCK